MRKDGMYGHLCGFDSTPVHSHEFLRGSTESRQKTTSPYHSISLHVTTLQLVVIVQNSRRVPWHISAARSLSDLFEYFIRIYTQNPTPIRRRLLAET
eukprot:scaffold20854_cov147-Skeletonema_marinoi.AAC.2